MSAKSFGKIGSVLEPKNAYQFFLILETTSKIKKIILDVQLLEFLQGVL